MTLTTRLVVLALLIAGGRSFIPGASTARRAVPRYAAIPSDDAASVARALLGGSAVVAPRAPARAPPARPDRRAAKGRLARGVDAVRSRVAARGGGGVAARSADLYHVDDEAGLRRLVLARTLGITALPHFQLYANGEMVDEFSTLSKAEISDAVQKLIENTN